MKIINIFALIKGSLYTVQFDHETEFIHAFAKCFEQWNDPIYLRDFFEENKTDLNHSFWNKITVEDAIRKTRKDANLLEQALLEIAETGKTERLETLSTIFEPLSKNVFGDYEKDKAKGILRQSWLRIYAIRIEANLFLVTGGGIKLTKKMEKHLLKELEKLEIAKQYLSDGNDEALYLVEIC